MLIIQLLGMFFGIFMAYHTYMHFRRKEFGKGIFFVWEVIWVGMIITVLFPKILDPVVHAFRFARTLDMLIIIAVIITITVSFFNYITVIKTQKKLEDLVRKIAIEHPKKSEEEVIDVGIFRQLINLAVYGKVWIQRTMSWLAIANSAMILFLVLAKLQEYGMKIYITKWFFPIYIVTLLLMILFGYIEEKTGLFKKEMDIVHKRDPINMEMLERLDRIEKKIDNIEKRKKK